MPDTFQKKSDFEEESYTEDLIQIPSLTEDIVYCPRCGTINSFKKSKSGRLLNHFCSRCSFRVNDFWDGYIEGHIKLVRCEACKEGTFVESIYCVACGAKQMKVFSERTSKISDAMGEDLDLVTAAKDIQEIKEEIKYSSPCLTGFCDFLSCLQCCCDHAPIGGCILVQIFPKSTSFMKSAYTISLVLFAMFQASFFILFFHSYIDQLLFYGIISIGIILTILVPLIIHRIYIKTKISK